MNSYIKKKEQTQLNNLILNLKVLEKEQSKPKAHTMEEITKTIAEINAIETMKTIQRIHESKSWFFERLKIATLVF